MKCGDIMDRKHKIEEPTEEAACGQSVEQLAYRQEIERLRRENIRQERIIRENLQLLRGVQNMVRNASEKLEIVESSKVYRLALCLRRFVAQCIRGESGGWKDFLRWIFSRPGKRKRAVPMSRFEMIHPIIEYMKNGLHLTAQKLDYYSGMETKGIMVKRGRKVFIFAGVPYYDIGGGQRFAQIAKTFDAMGFLVYYFYGMESAEQCPGNMYIPAVVHVRIDDYSTELLAEDAEQDSILIFEYPDEKCRPYLDYANAHGLVTVYEHVDNWDSSLGSWFYREEAFQKWIHDVQYISVTARMLGDKIRELGREDYIYCPNAADTAIFEPRKAYERPKDLVTGAKTLLYFGSLWGEWFDWDLITYVAAHCDCAINLIGDCRAIADKMAHLPGNIHFLGAKKQTELPAYLQHCDIALLPFKNDEIGKYVSPLKVFEYIAMNKPVLSTPLDELTAYPNVVVSDDRDVWVRTVNEGIHTVDASVFTAKNNWYARCNQLLDLVGRPRTRMPSVSAVILNHNNMNVIFRCVDSLLAFSDAYDMEIIVVDNNSTDGSRERLLTEYSGRIRIICSDKNGCACGRNLGVRHARGEMLWFLDSDQWVVGDHYLDAAIRILEETSGVGAVGWAAGWFERDSVVGPTTDELPNRGILAPWIQGRTDIAYLATDGLLMKRSLFEKIGGFDEAYDPTCFEDTDLSLKIRSAGYELVYCPYSAVLHLPHQTTNAGSRNHKILMERNGAYFAKKWQKENPELLKYYLFP